MITNCSGTVATATTNPNQTPLVVVPRARQDVKVSLTVKVPVVADSKKQAIDYIAGSELSDGFLATIVASLIRNGDYDFKFVD